MVEGHRLECLLLHLLVIIFRFFISIKFLEKKWDQVQLYINIFREQLKAVAEEDGEETGLLFD